MVNTEGMSDHDELGNRLKQRFLVPHVEMTMRQAIFHGNCHGKRISVVFNFVLIGNHSDHPIQYIESVIQTSFGSLPKSTESNPKN